MSERYYSVWNGFDNRLLEPEHLVMAKNGKEAVIKVLNMLNIPYKSLKRSGSRYVQMKATPVRIDENGNKYFDGNVSWYEVSR